MPAVGLMKEFKILNDSRLRVVDYSRLIWEEDPLRIELLNWGRNHRILVFHRSRDNELAKNLPTLVH